jgi:putative ABC transport system permease protein
VVATVLLVAASNIAGILLARGVGRSGEFAVRRVLGAGPLRLARQLLTESLLLAALGGAAGVALAAWLLALFRAFTPSELALEVGIEPAVLVFALAVCVAAGLIVGLAPVMQAWRLNVQPWLSGGNVVVKPARRRLRHMITIPQIACSLALLLVAGAYVRSLLDLETTDPGYDVANVAVANPVLRPDPSGEDPTLTEGQRAERYAARTRRFYTQLLDRIRAVPGIADGALTARLPLSGSADPGWFIVSQDRFLSGDRAGVPGDRHVVSPGYFGTLGISLTSGRDFDERDAFGRHKAAIVSRELAARLWRGRDPIGQTVTTADTWNGFKGTVEWFDVVGVVEDVMPVLSERGPRPAIYTSLAQEWRPSVAFIVARGHGDSRTLLSDLRTAVTSSDTFADVNRTATLQEMAAGILYPRRIAGAVLAISGGFAGFLALVGVYGVVSYSVAQRSGEIGVRIALGAGRTDILRLVLREGARIAAVGCVLGQLLGYAASPVSSSRNLALPPTDLTIMALTPLVFGLTVLLACYVPARRAGLLNPLDTLRR